MTNHAWFFWISIRDFKKYINTINYTGIPHPWGAEFHFNAVSQRQLNAKLDTYTGNTNPTLTFTASLMLITLNGSSALQWAGANLTSCSASGAWSGSRSVSGTESVRPSATSSYTLTCLGASSTLTQTVTVTMDTQAPTVTLLAPTSGSTVSGMVPVSASAVDDQGISRVDFYNDDVLMASDNTLPYGASWDATRDIAGLHIISVRAFDVAGNMGIASSTVTVAQSAQDTHAPQVAILSPLDATMVSGKVQVSASASDPIGVALLQLYIDGMSAADPSLLAPTPLPLGGSMPPGTLEPPALRCSSSICCKQHCRASSILTFSLDVR